MQFQMVREKNLTGDHPKQPKPSCPETKEGWVGVDPGHTNMFTAVYHEEGVWKHFGVSKRQWDHETLRTRANKVTARRKPSSVKGIEALWSRHPLGTTSSIAEACRVRFLHYQEVYEFYSTRNAARYKFKMAQRDQRAMDTHANRLLTLNRPIAFGNGSDGSSPGGKAGGPVKRFVRHLKRKSHCVRVVDEYLTSKACHGCCERTEEFRSKNEPKAHQKWREEKEMRRAAKLGLNTPGTRSEPASSFSVHGLRSCKNCCKTWNRDVNAAVNIALVGCCEGMGLCRPVQLRRHGPNDCRGTQRRASP